MISRTDTLTAAISVLAGPPLNDEAPGIGDMLSRIIGFMFPVCLFLVVTWIGWAILRYLMQHDGRGGTQVEYRPAPGEPPVFGPRTTADVYYVRSTPAPQPDADSETAIGRTWKQATAIRDEVRAAQAEWEFDLAEQIFYRPLLGETTEPLTAVLIDALAAMDEAFPDSQPRTVEVADRCLAAAQKAREAWRLADAHARNVGLGQLSPEDRRALETARKLLAAAADPGTVDEERRSQVEKVIDVLVAVTSRPKSVVAERVQSRLNAKLRELDIAPLRPAITQGPAR